MLSRNTKLRGHHADSRLQWEDPQLYISLLEEQYEADVADLERLRTENEAWLTAASEAEFTGGTNRETRETMVAVGKGTLEEMKRLRAIAAKAVCIACGRVYTAENSIAPCDCEHPLIAEVSRLRAWAAEATKKITERAPELERLRRLEAADTPWPCIDVLEMLSSIVDEHLLGHHGCDCLGHETRREAVTAAHRILAALAKEGT